MPAMTDLYKSKLDSRGGTQGLAPQVHCRAGLFASQPPAIVVRIG